MYTTPPDLQKQLDSGDKGRGLGGFLLLFGLVISLYAFFTPLEGLSGLGVFLGVLLSVVGFCLLAYFGQVHSRALERYQAEIKHYYAQHPDELTRIQRVAVEVQQDLVRNPHPEPFYARYPELTRQTDEAMEEARKVLAKPKK
jgi:hypothetical protein